MKTKITPDYFKIDVLKGFFFLLLLFLANSNLLAQVISSVNPTRITHKSVITITGSGFLDTHDVEIAGDVIKFNITSRNATSIVLQISNELFSNSSGMLSINGVDWGNIHYAGLKIVDIKNDSPYQVKEVYTNWKTIWHSNDYDSGSRSTFPNDKHDLLGFKMRYGGNDVIFSTGVQDDVLEAKLVAQGVDTTSESGKYKKEVFKAYSTNGIAGNSHKENYLAMADLIDGKEDIRELNDNVRRTVYDVLIDGSHGQGLELGTGIANLNKFADVRFFSGNGQEGGLDDVPDLLITQIADPGGHTGKDIYYYADINGNIVGRPIRLQIDNKADPEELFKWRVDLYKLSYPRNYDVALPQNSESFPSGQVRPYRMVAFQLQDFEISNITELEEVSNINMMAGGSADISFIAYNRKAFNIKSPLVELFPISRFVCEIGSSVSFDTKVGIDGGATASAISDEEELHYAWYKNNILLSTADSDTYVIPNVQDSHLNDHYRVRVSNDYGAVDLNFSLALGGTPTYWSGAEWVYPSSYYKGEGANKELRFPIDTMDRNLIFSSDYLGQNVDLEGCDCVVPSGNNVVIPAGKTLKLKRNIIVGDELKFFDESIPPKLIDTISAGTFTLENNASLIQINNPILESEKNKGNIIVKRVADELHKDDYVYWSSPVFGNKIATITGSSRYEWNVNKVNDHNNTRGNWVAPASLDMINGKGYIVRVPSSATFTNNFIGEPNNGNISINIEKTGGSPDMDSGNMDWNLIGNPYPSAINAEEFLRQNTASIEGVSSTNNIEGGVYIWTHGTEAIKGAESPFYEKFGYNYSAEDYKTVNALASSDPVFNGNIAAGQGFFVKAKSKGNVIFKNDMRFDKFSGKGYENNQFYRASNNSKNSKISNSEKQLLWLVLTNEAKVATVAVVGYAEGATYGEDALYDATTMGNGEFSIYSPVNEKRMAIQGRPLPFDDQDQVSLGVAIPKNGIYNIGIDHLKGSVMLNEDQGIYLEDTYTNVIHNLRTAPYGFTATIGDVKDRFVLRYTNKTLSVDDQKMSDTFVYVKNEQLYVKASKNIESVVVYDLTGKKLMDYKLDRYNDRFNVPFQFPKGAYLTIIKLENAGSTTKKVMN